MSDISMLIARVMAMEVVGRVSDALEEDHFWAIGARELRLVQSQDNDRSYEGRKTCETSKDTANNRVYIRKKPIQRPD
jgi:hypothetical protein